MGFLVRLIGIEPTHPAPEAGALSTELQAHMKLRSLVYHTFSKMKSIFFGKLQNFFKKKSLTIPAMDDIIAYVGTSCRYEK